MQAKTFGTWASFFTSVGAGALTQSPDYTYLALPVALISGTLFVILAVMFLLSNRKEIWALVRKLEPTHLIIFGLLVAAVGVGWQIYRGTSPVIAAVQLAPTAAAKPSPVVPKVHTNAYDIPKKLRVIDEQVLPILKTEMAKLGDLGQQLQSNWRNRITADRPTYMLDLQIYFSQWNDLAQKIGNLRLANEYYEDIAALLNQDYQQALIDGFGSFKGAVGSIGDPPYNMDLDFFMKPYSDKCSDGFRAMDTWRFATIDKFVNLRKELASLQ